MLHRLIANTKLPQIKAHHLRLDLHLIELLPAVDANHAADHLRHDDHIAEVGLHELGLLVGLGFLLGFAEFLDEAHGFAFEAAVEAAPGARVDHVPELFGGEVQESEEVSWGKGGRGGGKLLVEVDTAVGEFAEGSLLLELCFAGRRLAVVFLRLGHDARRVEVIKVWVVRLYAEVTYQQPPRRSATD